MMGGMMGGSGFGFGGLGLIGMILNLVITVGVIVGIVLLVVWLVRRAGAEGTASQKPAAGICTVTTHIKPSVYC